MKQDESTPAPGVLVDVERAHSLILVLRAQSGHRLNKWLEKYGLECHDSTDWLELQNNVIDAYLAATTQGTPEGAK